MLLPSRRPHGSWCGSLVARAIYPRCPVIIDCRTWALDHAEDDGIWDAPTAAPRRAITEPSPATRRRNDETDATPELGDNAERGSAGRGHRATIGGGKNRLREQLAAERCGGWARPTPGRPTLRPGIRATVVCEQAVPPGTSRT
ncbi:WhiB family transcriptional regulator [Streptomyces sp. NPDC014846]|uniref:WhiB family transcriptional regulator n=1 Tax=Streptomyces sp. NPDC014846 TaxID=3364922 RepID=UPI0036FA369B